MSALRHQNIGAGEAFFPIAAAPAREQSFIPLQWFDLVQAMALVLRHCPKGYGNEAAA
jgi:hypothetical protein